MGIGKVACRGLTAGKNYTIYKNASSWKTLTADRQGELLIEFTEPFWDILTSIEVR
jgi:hypothetical protein